MEPSRYSSLGATVEYYSNFSGVENFIDKLDIPLSDWQHTISAFGGFNTAQFSIYANTLTIEDWIENGLGRVIRVYDDSNEMIWEGFVDKVTAVYSGLEISVGPLVSIGNRIELIYTSYDFSTDPPTPGLRKKTSAVNDTDSQDKYGIYHKVLSAAGISDANALSLRSTYLEHHSWPETTSNFSLQRSELRLMVECKGFHYLLGYPYNLIGVTGTVDISEKIGNILQNDPNLILTDTSRIQENTLAVPAAEDQDTVASELIKGLVAMGDTNSSRYLFGLYEERIPIYEQASTFVDYTISFRDPARNVFDDSGGIIQPWQIRPGKWVFFTDFLPGNPYIADPTQYQRDPRMLFIEEVVFTLPQGFALNGGKFSSIEQKLARLGLSGVSV